MKKTNIMLGFLMCLITTGCGLFPINPPVNPPVDPPVSPPIAITNHVDNLPNKQLFIIGATRHWSKIDPVKSAALVYKYGAHGRSYELIELEPSGLGREGMVKYLTAQINKIAPYIEADRKYGLISKVYFYNTNASADDCPSVAQFKQLIDLFGQKVGWNGVMCLFMNENDSNTPSSTISQITSYGLSKLQSGYKITYEGNPKTDFAEYHPQSVGAFPGANKMSTFIVPDNGPILRNITVLTRSLYTDAEGANPEPKLEAWKTFIKTAWAQGKSVDCYNFDNELPDVWVKTCCEAANLKQR